MIVGDVFVVGLFLLVAFMLLPALFELILQFIEWLGGG